LLRLIHSKLASNDRGCVTGFGRFGIVETVRPYQRNRTAESGRAHFWVCSKPGPEHRTQAHLQTMRLGNGMAAASQAHARAGGKLVAQRVRQTRTVITTASASEASAYLYIAKRCRAGVGPETAGQTSSQMCFCVYKNSGSGGEAPPPDTPALALTDGGRLLRSTA
jgi:hypothetical protein